MTAAIAAALDCDETAVTVCSTGVIGRFLNIEAIRPGLPRVAAALGDSPAHLRNAAEGMRTTDTFPKLSTRSVPSRDGGSARISGVAKGAAMIAPNMATMLGVILTDAALAPADADRLLRTAVDSLVQPDQRRRAHVHQRHRVTAGQRGRGRVRRSGVRRGVGRKCARSWRRTSSATRRGRRTSSPSTSPDWRPSEDATTIARAVADSPLVKTAIHGADPNWGRILSAAGIRRGAVRCEPVRPRHQRARGLSRRRAGGVRRGDVSGRFVRSGTARCG